MTAFEIFRVIKLSRFCQKFAKTRKILPLKYSPKFITRPYAYKVYNYLLKLIHVTVNP